MMALIGASLARAEADSEDDPENEPRLPDVLRVIDWSYDPTGFKLSSEYFRTPFSAELLIAVPRLDFIQRSQIVRALAPSRQVGVQLLDRYDGFYGGSLRSDRDLAIA